MAKTPQDHKTKKTTRWEEIDGHELLKPFSKVKGSDQVRLMSRLQTLGLIGAAADTDEVDALDSLDLDATADFIDWVAEKFALDIDAFEDFTSGPGGYERALSLAVAYAGLLGESDSSTS